MKEVLIVRNTCINRLYDVIEVDFMLESVLFVAKAIEYEDAVKVLLDMEETV